MNTNLVSLVRHALGHTDELVSYPALVDERFASLAPPAAQQTGRDFTDDQITYLRLIKEHFVREPGCGPRLTSRTRPSAPTEA